MLIKFLGDVYLDGKYTIDFPIDMFVVNLEFPISRRGKPSKGKVNLKSEKSYIKETFGTNPIAVCLANNHIFDYGFEAFNDTISFLDSNTIGYFGINTSNPYMINLKDKKIALFGYVCSSTHPAKEDGYNVSELYLEKILEDITKIKNEVDFIVLQFHWGEEEIPFPKYSDVQIAHQCIEAGADLIIGHHAHVIQSHEVYMGKHIFYGLGNFIFPDLNVDAMYDGKQFTQKYVKKQNRQNRQSIVVEVNNKLEINFFTAEFKDGIVKKKKISIPKWIPESEQSFYQRLSYQKKINMLKKFMYNPRIPSIVHLKRFLGLEK